MIAAFLTAIVFGLRPDDQWDARYNPEGRPTRSGWPVVILVILSLMIGTGLLMAGLAISFQTFFESQVEAASCRRNNGRGSPMHFDLLDIAVFVRAAALGNLSPRPVTWRCRHRRQAPDCSASKNNWSAVAPSHHAPVVADRRWRAIPRACRTVAGDIRGGRPIGGPGRRSPTRPAARHRPGIVRPPARIARDSRFLAAYPDITLDLRLTDQIVGLVDAGIDVALRMGALPDSSLVARPLAPSRRVICASPDYLGRHGTPRIPKTCASTTAWCWAINLHGDSTP
jgi:hypothetical protein